MMDDNSPQLGGLPQVNAQGDLSPVISGRGTQIIADARGAYEAGNIDALFAALNALRRVEFQQAVVRQVLDHMRADIEAAVEDNSFIPEFLRDIDEWLTEPADQTNVQRLEHWHHIRLLYPRIPVYSFGMRLRHVLSAVLGENVREILSATRALRVTPDWYAVPDEPHRSVIAYEIRQWSLDLGWAILNGRAELPSLLLEPSHIEALIADVGRWHRERNLPLLIHLMTDDQRAQFKQAIRQQAMHYIERVPASLWKHDEQQVIEQVRQWLADPSSVHTADLQELRYRYARGGNRYPSVGAVGSLLGTFADFSNSIRLDSSYTDSALNVTRYVKWMLKGGLSNILSTPPAQISFRWQLDAAYAILTDQPLPPLGDLNDGR